MTVVLDPYTANKMTKLQAIKDWIVTEYDYRDKFEYCSWLTPLENLEYDVDELVEFLNENFCLDGYFWTMENGKLEYVYELIK